MTESTSLDRALSAWGLADANVADVTEVGAKEGGAVVVEETRGGYSLAFAAFAERLYGVERQAAIFSALLNADSEERNTLAGILKLGDGSKYAKDNKAALAKAEEWLKPSDPSRWLMGHVLEYDSGRVEHGRVSDDDAAQFAYRVTAPWAQPSLERGYVLQSSVKVRHLEGDPAKWAYSMTIDADEGLFSAGSEMTMRVQPSEAGAGAGTTGRSADGARDVVVSELDLFVGEVRIGRITRPEAFTDEQLRRLVVLVLGKTITYLTLLWVVRAAALASALVLSAVGGKFNEESQRRVKGLWKQFKKNLNEAIKTRLGMAMRGKDAFVVPALRDETMLKDIDAVQALRTELPVADAGELPVLVRRIVDASYVRSATEKSDERKRREWREVLVGLARTDEGTKPFADTMEANIETGTKMLLDFLSKHAVLVDARSIKLIVDALRTFPGAELPTWIRAAIGTLISEVSYARLVRQTNDTATKVLDALENSADGSAKVLQRELRTGAIGNAADLADAVAPRLAAAERLLDSQRGDPTQIKLDANKETIATALRSWLADVRAVEETVRDYDELDSLRLFEVNAAEAEESYARLLDALLVERGVVRTLSRLMRSRVKAVASQLRGDKETLVADAQAEAAAKDEATDEQIAEAKERAQATKEATDLDWLLGQMEPIWEQAFPDASVMPGASAVVDNVGTDTSASIAPDAAVRLQAACAALALDITARRLDEEFDWVLAIIRVCERIAAAVARIYDGDTLTDADLDALTEWPTAAIRVRRVRKTAESSRNGALAGRMIEDLETMKKVQPSFKVEQFIEAVRKTDKDMNTETFFQLALDTILLVGDEALSRGRSELASVGSEPEATAKTKIDNLTGVLRWLSVAAIAQKTGEDIAVSSLTGVSAETLSAAIDATAHWMARSTAAAILDAINLDAPAADAVTQEQRTEYAAALRLVTLGERKPDRLNVQVPVPGAATLAKFIADDDTRTSIAAYEQIQKDFFLRYLRTFYEPNFGIEFLDKLYTKQDRQRSELVDSIVERAMTELASVGDVTEGMAPALVAAANAKTLLGNAVAAATFRDKMTVLAEALLKTELYFILVSADPDGFNSVVFWAMVKVERLLRVVLGNYGERELVDQPERVPPFDKDALTRGLDEILSDQLAAGGASGSDQPAADGTEVAKPTAMEGTTDPVVDQTRAVLPSLEVGVQLDRGVAQRALNTAVKLVTDAKNAVATDDDGVTKTRALLERALETLGDALGNNEAKPDTPLDVVLQMRTLYNRVRALLYRSTGDPRYKPPALGGADGGSSSEERRAERREEVANETEKLRVEQEELRELRTEVRKIRADVLKDISSTTAVLRGPVYAQLTGAAATAVQGLREAMTLFENTRDEFNDAVARIPGKTKEIEGLKKKIAKNIETMATQRDLALSEAAKAEVAQKNLTDATKKLRSALEAYNKELPAVTAAVGPVDLATRNAQTLEKALNNVTEALRSTTANAVFQLKTDAAASHESTRKQLVELRTKADRLEREKADLKTRVDNLEVPAPVAGDKPAGTVTADTVAAVREELKKFGDRITDMEGKVGTSASTADNANSSAEKNKRSIADIKAKQETFETDITGAVDTAFKSEVKKLRDEIQAKVFGKFDEFERRLKVAEEELRIQPPLQRQRVGGAVGQSRGPVLSRLYTLASSESESDSEN